MRGTYHVPEVQGYLVEDMAGVEPGLHAVLAAKALVVGLYEVLERCQGVVGEHAANIMVQSCLDGA